MTPFFVLFLPSDHRRGFACVRRKFQRRGSPCGRRNNFRDVCPLRRPPVLSFIPTRVARLAPRDRRAFGARAQIPRRDGRAARRAPRRALARVRRARRRPRGELHSLITSLSSHPNDADPPAHRRRGRGRTRTPVQRERDIAAAVVERAGRAQSTIAASRHHAASHRRRASSFWWFGGLSFARLWWGWWWRRLSRYKAELVSELRALLAGLVPALSAGHLAHLLRAVHASLADPDAAPAAIQVRYAWCGVRRRHAARRRRRAPAAAAPASGSQPARRARVPRRDCAREGRSTPLERNPSERRGHHPH